MALFADHAKVVYLYANQYRDVFPLQGDHSGSAAARWFAPVIQAGLLPNSGRAIDPKGDRLMGAITIQMSRAMTMRSEIMTPGQTVSGPEQASSPIRTSDVLFPSDKGLLFRMEIDKIGDHVFLWPFATGPESRLGEVAFCDGSASLHKWLDLLPDGLPDRAENGIGYPVMTTWFGVRGRDRR